MNEATESPADAPRRSGRERKKVVSVITEAKRVAVAERKKAKNSGNFERNTRNSRRCKPEEEDEDEYSDEDSYASSDEEDGKSDVSSDDEENSEGGDKRSKPFIKRRGHWKSDDESAYQSVDGDRLFTTCYWGNRERRLTWDARSALGKGQKSLLAEQEKSCITLNTQLGRSSSLTQVPYHEDLMPFYEYFADGVKQRPAMESFRITNHNLPPSPWLESSILSVLETFSNVATLELSNCSLSADDLSSLAKFIAKNTTLATLDISRNNIVSEDTVKALTKAIKKHPALCSVNLAYCKLAGGSGALEKMLTACKSCEHLEIGSEEFGSKCVAAVANFIGKKSSVTSFSLTGASVDKENKKLLSEALVKNKTIEMLSFQNNKLALPGIIQTTKKGLKSLSRLTHLELSHNSLPAAGAKAMAKFLEGSDCKVVTLDLSSNHLTTKGASYLLPALKKNTTLQHLDLSKNWLNDGVAPIVIDMLQNNSTLLELNLKFNKGLKNVREEKERRSWYRNTRTIISRRDGGRFEIVRGALFDTKSFDSIAGSNHVCAVEMSGKNQGDSFEDTMSKINALDASVGKKIRYKVVLALNHVNTDLYNPRSFDDVPLEMMPFLLEMLQQDIGYNGFGKDIAPKNMPNMDTAPYRSHGHWNRETRSWESRVGRRNPLTGKIEMKGEISKDTKSLSRVFEVIMSSQSLPQLFSRGPGEFDFTNKGDSSTTTAEKTEKKKKNNKAKSKKRKKFGDPDDDDDDAWIPRGARKTAKYVWDQESRKYTRIDPPVY